MTKIVLFLSIFSFLAPADTPVFIKLFEGEVEYRIDFEILDPSIRKSDLRAVYGKKAIARIRPDRYVIRYDATGPEGAYVQLVLLKDRMIYSYFEKGDSLYVYATDTPPGTLIRIEEVKDDPKMIQGKSCSYIQMDYTPNGPTAVERVRSKYYFSKAFRLKKKHYRFYTLDFWNEYVRRSGSVSLDSEIRYEPFYVMRSQVVRVEAKSIGDASFVVPKDRPLVYE